MDKFVLLRGVRKTDRIVEKPSYNLLVKSVLLLHSAVFGSREFGLRCFSDIEIVPRSTSASQWI